MAFLNFYDSFLAPLIYGNTENALTYIINVGLIPSMKPCASCNILMHHVIYSKTIDGVAFRCMNKNCIKYKSYYSIRMGTFFEGFKVSLNKCLYIMYKWSNDELQSSINTDTGICKPTIKNFYAKMRSMCKNYFIINPIKLGGNGIICQIDESLFRHKPKNHRGRATQHEIWVFGIADTSSSPAKIYLKLVENRSSSVLLPIIQQICRPGSIIYSDKWKAYDNINSLGFQHETVNHSLYFVDPNTNVNTQTIEAYWAKVKLRIKKMKGVCGNLLYEYLDEWMWKDNVFGKNWENLLDLIKISY